MCTPARPRWVPAAHVRLKRSLQPSDRLLVAADDLLPDTLQDVDKDLLAGSLSSLSKARASAKAKAPPKRKRRPKAQEHPHLEARPAAWQLPVLP